LIFSLTIRLGDFLLTEHGLFRLLVTHSRGKCPDLSGENKSLNMGKTLASLANWLRILPPDRKPVYETWGKATA